MALPAAFSASVTGRGRGAGFAEEGATPGDPRRALSEEDSIETREEYGSDARKAIPGANQLSRAPPGCHPLEI